MQFTIDHKLATELVNLVAFRINASIMDNWILTDVMLSYINVINGMVKVTILSNGVVYRPVQYRLIGLDDPDCIEKVVDLYKEIIYANNSQFLTENNVKDEI